jgi:hypothetical protein
MHPVIPVMSVSIPHHWHYVYLSVLFLNGGLSTSNLTKTHTPQQHNTSFNVVPINPTATQQEFVKNHLVTHPLLEPPHHPYPRDTPEKEKSTISHMTDKLKQHFK